MNHRFVSFAGLSLVGFAALAACDGDDDYVEGEDTTPDAATSSSSSSSGSSSGASSSSGNAPRDGGADAAPDASPDAAPDSGVATVEVFTDAFCPISCSQVEVGQTMPLGARVLDAEGNELTGIPVTWESETPAIVTVGADGVSTGVGTGTGTVRATAGGVSGTIGLSIIPSPVVRVVIDPGTKVLGAIGETATFTATAYNRIDQVVPDATFDWYFSNPDLGTISAAGVFTGKWDPLESTCRHASLSIL